MVGGIDGTTDMSTSWLPLSTMDQRFKSTGVKLIIGVLFSDLGAKYAFMKWETFKYLSRG